MEHVLELSEMSLSPATGRSEQYFCAGFPIGLVTCTFPPLLLMALVLTGNRCLKGCASKCDFQRNRTVGLTSTPSVE